MTLYVDNGTANILLLADTHVELMAHAPVYGELSHVPPDDEPRVVSISAQARTKLLAAGLAVPITWRQAGYMHRRRVESGELGKPEDAEAWVVGHLFMRETTNQEDVLW